MYKMPKESKIQTPEWIIKGFDSPAEYQKSLGKKVAKKKTSEKTFKLRLCPKCNSDEVGVVLTGEEGRRNDDWECRKCKFIGKSFKEKELTEEEFMKYLDEKGEEVA